MSVDRMVADERAKPPRLDFGLDLLAAYFHASHK